MIGYVWPEPRSSAASGHVMQLIRCFLEHGWQITFASPATEGEHRADLVSLGITEVHIELNNSSFDAFVSDLQPDVVLFDQFMIEEQFGWRVEQQCPGALRILETSDLQSLRHARHQRLKDLLNEESGNDVSDLFGAGDAELFSLMAASDLAQREIASLYRCDLNLMTSDVEIDLLTGSFGMPASLLHWCPLMLDEPSRAARPFDQRAHFLSIGNFRHAPNWDAVLWMKNAIWPLIRQQLPQAQLHIYGAYTPPKATALHNGAQGFHIMNWAEDALQVMSDARVCLAPLRFGAGIKGKLIDAMLCGTPSVTTPIGAEAMSGGLPWPGKVETDPAHIADAAVRLYQNRALWSEAQTAGWTLLNARFRHEQHCASLMERIDALRRDLPSHRLANFTGSMLRHHHHKSTKYMAQWIEAKNRKV
ncbi:glycosyltransferase family 4 protein [Pseudomonas alliivorans]|uniref:Glycosyltransferase n=1 Tax=Pseudomonas alliivorans TaxID=2810613 RepID=A0ABS4C2D2_9PSED|nr:glycosyltransferase family 4 protein [Pseudomonas alliivorans]MBP0944796.1 glycosyltransferase [Pseudomonas alliivorans]MEE4324759.1 glycosyltransferase family 4 protein [Pseudomonas alliivorans]MEE4333199.1 glycosyltransferase family 4 protein [Pseudomonas alliivorans]MEE4366289.1 glycosyltransferase family 4 protein [Pseudomonas alliivorans]